MQIKHSFDLLKVYETALAEHRQSTSMLAVSASGSRSDKLSLAARLNQKAWSLVEDGQILRKEKLLWEGLSFIGIGAILIFGVWSFGVSDKEIQRRRQAEDILRQEQFSLERRITERTAELRAEVEERRLAEERNRRQKRVLELLASNAPLPDVLRELTASVAVQRRSWEAAIHLVEPASGSLQLIASSNVSEWLEHYLKSIAINFADAPESSAWVDGKPQFVASMTEVRRPWSELLVSNGIRSVWSLPLTLASGQRAGTLTIYSRLFGLPNETERELLDATIALAGLVLEVRRMNDELLRNAYEDGLTGVSNRRAGERRLHLAIAKARDRQESMAVLWIDLDRFKRVNDLYGHAGGDRVLVEVARRIAACSGVNGSVARVGGDEFLVMLESGASEEDAKKIALELNARICEPIPMRGGETATVGASIGLTIYPRDGETSEELERHADTAMYQAKRSGMGLCVFSHSIGEETVRGISIEEGLREALEAANDKTFLYLHYQPVMTASGNLFGVEALLRFTHSELGEISPTQFIKLAEETKLIHPLGRWVLHEVCRQIMNWKAEGLPSVRVAVNISSVQWGQENFVNEISGLVNMSGIDPAILAFEVTESAVMQNADLATFHMRQLKTMGFRLAIDDFGTGYSSLSHLHEMPLDVLKIDRSFTARLGRANDSRTIVHSVISMAHLLGIITVAEGVETEEQERMLVEMGCDAFQGFLYSRPMPGPDTSRWIRSLLADGRIAPADPLRPGRNRHDGASSKPAPAYTDSAPSDLSDLKQKGLRHFDHDCQVLTVQFEPPGALAAPRRVPNGPE